MSELNSTNWSETAASNNALPPDGGPEGMNPSDVNNWVRELMSALKKDWNQKSFGATFGGSANAYTITNAVARTAYFNGMRVTYKVPAAAANTAASTLAVDALAATPIRKGDGSVALAANDMQVADYLELVYDSTLSVFRIIGHSRVATSFSSYGTLAGQNAAGVALDVTMTSKKFVAAAQTIASASTVDLSTATGNVITISGTTTVNSFGTLQAGASFDLIFSGALTVTYNAVSMILPGLKSIPVNPGDTASIVSLGGGNWQMTNYVPASGPFVSGAINGLTLSRASATTYGVAVGYATNEDGSAPFGMTLQAAFTKSLSAWAAGSTNGSLDTGAIAATTWYHVHMIRKTTDGSVDFLLSLSASAPTMPGGWAGRRRIGSIKTNGSSQIVAFTQNFDEFLWDAAVVDVDQTNPGAAALTLTLSVPTNVTVTAIISGGCFQGSTNGLGATFSSLAMSDQAPQLATTAALTGFNSVGAISGVASWMLSEERVRTNTSGQIRGRLSTSGAADHIGVITRGWIDTRGKL